MTQPQCHEPCAASGVISRLTPVDPCRSCLLLLNRRSARCFPQVPSASLPGPERETNPGPFLDLSR